MPQGTGNNNAEGNKQTTSSSTLKQPIQTISKDRVIVDSILPEEEEDPEKTQSDPPYDVEDLETDQQHANEGNEVVSSPVEGDKRKTLRESNFENNSEPTDIDEDNHQKAVDESKGESQHDSPELLLK